MPEFDTRTHIVDPKTGKLIKHQPYRMEIDRDRGTTFYRDGIAYNPDGSVKNEKPIIPSIAAEAPKAEEAGVKRNARS